MQGLVIQKGFTIVELLIVVVVIAILATITIVSYNGIQNRAYDSTVQSDIKNFAKIVEMQNGEKSTYPFPLAKEMGIRVSTNAYKVRNNLYYCVNTTDNRYAIAAISRSGKGYSYSSTGSLQEYANGDGSISGGGTCSLAGVSSWSTTYGTCAISPGNACGDMSWVNS